MDIEAVVAGLQQLFADAKIDEIEPYLLNAYERAAGEGDYGSMLSIANELIGVSREVCHYDQMIAYGQDALKLVDQMGIQGTVPHATTLLNIANGLRAGGYLDQSAKLYDEVEGLYKQLLSPEDFGFADLYNNRSLLYQDQERYELAAEELNKALEIALSYPDRTWEVATTNANLANTYIALAGQDNNPMYLKQARKAAERAIAMYERLCVKDTHYGAAVCALGKVYEAEQEYGKAVSCYLNAEEAIRSTLGETDFYRTVQEYEKVARTKMIRAGQRPESYRIAEITTETMQKTTMPDAAAEEELPTEAVANVDEPEVIISDNPMRVKVAVPEKTVQKKSVQETVEPDETIRADEVSIPGKRHEYKNGMELSRAYYEEIGKPMLLQKFKDTYEQMTIGHIGEGSDCYEFDDIYSRDHDWGIGFSIWLDDELYNKIGEDLQREYESLPKEWEGYSRQTLLTGRNRVGVHKTSEYLRRQLGHSAYTEWKTSGQISRPTVLGLESYQLAALCNGTVFHANPESEFMRLRTYLQQFYDDSTLCILLAEHICRFGQNAQYNYARMRKRGDDLTAWLVLAEGMKEALKIGYLCNRMYAPHDKWLVKGTERFTCLTGILELIRKISRAEADRLHDPSSSTDPESMIEELADQIIEELLNRGYVGNARLIECENGYYLDNYLEHYGPELQLRSDYLLMKHDELVEYIAKMEFRAFDKVKNEGGRASCQDDWETFHIMRTSQYTTWTDEMLVQYAIDFQLALDRGWNMIMEKYGRMEADTVPEEWNRIQHEFPEIPDAKRNIMEKIIQIQVGWMEEFAKEYPNMASNARRIHTSEDQPWDTSYETYLRGELSTYSDKMLNLYGQFIVNLVQNNNNLAYMIMEETVHRYGYADISSAAGKLDNA